MVAIVLHALWSLRTTAARDKRDVIVVVLALTGAVVGIPELLVLLILGVASVLLRLAPRSLGVVMALPAVALVSPSLVKIFLVFLQIGSVIYGSGYVLLVF